MAKMYPALNDVLSEFIAQQKVFFVGSATADSRVNVSPKGMDTLRVLDPGRIAWLNVTGSGNETSAHVQITPRMTLMFCAFTGNALILRVYGTAMVHHPHDAAWADLYALFPPIAGARQIFELRVDSVQTSCGMAVPYLDFRAERTQQTAWAEKKGEAGIRAYWQEKNAASIDGLPTHILGDEPGA